MDQELQEIVARFLTMQQAFASLVKAATLSDDEHKKLQTYLDKNLPMPHSTEEVPSQPSDSSPPQVPL